MVLHRTRRIECPTSTSKRQLTMVIAGVRLPQFFDSIGTLLIWYSEEKL